MVGKGLGKGTIDEQKVGGMNDFIEEWFQSISRPREGFLLYLFLGLDTSTLLVPHIHQVIQVQFSYLDTSLSFVLIREWLLWKLVYT